MNPLRAPYFVVTIRDDRRLSPPDDEDDNDGDGNDDVGGQEFMMIITITKNVLDILNPDNELFEEDNDGDVSLLFLFIMIMKCTPSNPVVIS